MTHRSGHRIPTERLTRSIRYDTVAPMRRPIPWHAADDATEAAIRLKATVEELWDAQSALRERWLRNFSFYYGMIIDRWDQLSIPDRAYDDWAGSEDVEVSAWNLTRSIVDAYVSRVGVNAPEPRFLTEGSSYEQQEQAHLRELFVRGAMLRARTRTHAKTALWSSAICGTGSIKTYGRGRDVWQRYLRPDLVLIDSASVLDDGRPRTAYHREPIDRYELLAWADDRLRQSIEDAPRCHQIGDRIDRDRVLVVEAWCRPLGSQPGRHMLIMPDASDPVLAWEEWDEDAIPISQIGFARSASGHVGDSLAGIVEGCARLINRLLWRAVQNHDHLATPMLIGPSALEPLMRDNRQWRYLPSDEGAPQVIAPNAISPETLDLIERCWARGYEISGMSQYAAMGTKPAGLDSGRAIIEHNDLQTMRYSDPEGEYEHYQAVELAEQILRAGKRIADEEGWSVEIEDGEVVRRIDWGDLDLEHSWRVTVWPASALGSTPSGRQQKISEMVRLGAIDRDELRQLLRLGDLDRQLELTTSTQDLWRYILDRVAGNAAWIEPTEYDRPDLPQGIMMARYYRARAIVDGKPDAAQRLEDWIAIAASILDTEPEQPQAPATGPEISGGLAADPQAASLLAQAQAATAGPTGPEV